MGIQDLMRLYPVVSYCRQLERKYGWGYTFAWDQGTFETAISIHENGQAVRPAPEQKWAGVSHPWRLFCPDIIDFDNKTIIEFEETPGRPRRGARLAKKGHDPDGMDPRTEERDAYYSRGKFRVLKIFDYDAEQIWKQKVKKFLLECWKNKPSV